MIKYIISSLFLILLSVFPAFAAEENGISFKSIIEEEGVREGATKYNTNDNVFEYKSLFGNSALPQQVIDAILSSPLKDSFDSTGSKKISGKIFRYKQLTFNPKSILTWDIGNLDIYSDYIIIAASNIVINLPPRIEDAASLKVVTSVDLGQLGGNQGKNGDMGRVSGTDDGSNGGVGNTGGTGGKGQTYNYPKIYIVFQKITINAGNPVSPQGLVITARGVSGGVGGRGGDGGPGGYGARGTPGDRNCFLGICTCSAGPGRGGDGGNGGTGGKGGDGGRAGNGAGIIFVGPAAEFERLSHFGTDIAAGAPGQPGAGGSAGPAGREGGGGSKPFECVDGGGSGRAGGSANPLTLGPGNVGAKGIDGAVLLGARDNSDLFQ